MREGAAELASDVYHRGLESVQELKARVPELRDLVGRIRACEPALLEITTALPGAIDGRSIQVDPLLRELELVLDNLEDLEPARIPVLTPYTDEEPQVIRTADGGWVRLSHAGDTELGEQPERVERPS